MGSSYLGTQKLSPRTFGYNSVRRGLYQMLADQQFSFCSHFEKKHRLMYTILQSSINNIHSHNNFINSSIVACRAGNTNCSLQPCLQLSKKGFESTGFMLGIGHCSFCSQFLTKQLRLMYMRLNKDFICWWSVATPTLIWKLYLIYLRGRKTITSACTSTAGKQFRCPPLSWGGKGLRSREGTAIISPFNPCPFSWCPTSFSWWCVLCGIKVTILTKSLLAPDTPQKVMDVSVMGSLVYFASLLLDPKLSHFCMHSCTTVNHFVQPASQPPLSLDEKAST